MIVQCPSCASRYRVNEANIPSSGGRIRCPSCEHAFVVYPEPEPSFEDDTDDKTSIIMSPNIQEMIDNHQHNLKSKRPPMAEEEESMTEVMDASDIPSMLGPNDKPFGMQGGQQVEDHTVEMTSPLNLSRELHNFERDPNRIKDDGQTTELTADALKKGLQAAAAARHMAAKSSANAPPPMPLPTPSGQRTTRIPSVSQGVAAIPRPPSVSQGISVPSRAIQPTPQASPHSLQKLGQQSPGGLPGAESKSKPGMRFPSDPVGGRSFGEEPVSRSPVATAGSIAPGSIAGPNQLGGNFPVGLGDSDATGVNMMAPVIISSEPDPAHVGPWHLRTNFGLTYEFADTKGLRSWLSNRDELDGLTLSCDGNAFFELNQFQQIQTTSVTGAMQSVGAPSASGGNAAFNAPPVPGFGGSQRLTSAPFSTADGQSAVPDFGFAPGQYTATPPDPSSRITPDVYRPPSGGSKMELLLWPVLILLMIFAIVLVLQTLEIVDIKSALFGPGQISPDNARVVEVVQQPEDLADSPADLAAQEANRAREVRRIDQFERIILTAQEDIDENRLQIASEKLLTAKGIDPNSIAIHEMLVDVYTRLGQTTLAEETSATLSKLREKPLPPAGE